MSQKALFITVNDLKRKSIIDGNVDGDKLVQFIEVAQDLHIQNYLGGALYTKMQELIISGDIDLVANADYKTLRDSYIKPMLVWFSQSSYLPFAMYQVDNGGVSKHRAENTDEVNYRDIDNMLSKINENAEFYVRRFLDYICDNSNLYPEYNQSQNGEMNPDKSGGNFTGWIL